MLHLAWYKSNFPFFAQISHLAVMEQSLELFRHIVKQVKAHEQYHHDHPVRSFTAVPKECLANVNLLKSSLPTLYSAWLVMNK